MNKVRLIGLVLLVIGIIIQFTLDNDISEFLSASFFCIGLGLLIAGKIMMPKI